MGRPMPAALAVIGTHFEKSKSRQVGGGTLARETEGAWWREESESRGALSACSVSSSSQNGANRASRR